LTEIEWSASTTEKPGAYSAPGTPSERGRMTIVVEQNVSLRMIDMSTGSDRRSRDPKWIPLEGYARAQPKVEQYPP
jgi:hypothetical protein